LRFEENVNIKVGVSVSARGTITYGAESYRRFAEENGFRQETLEKVIRLGQVLSEIAIVPELSKSIALKGGTALNLMSEPIRRLSVDLDFNYIRAVNREKMLEDKPKILGLFRMIADRLEYKIDLPKDAHGGSTFALRYKNSLGPQDQIEIDINLITSVPLGPLQLRTLWQPREVERPVVQMVPTEELIVGKLRALIDRVAARDVFDAGFLPELLEGEWPSPRVKALFVLYTGTLDHPLTSYSLYRIDRLTETDYQNKLLPVLNLDEAPKREKLIEHAKEVLRPMLQLEPNHVEFVERLKKGDFRPELVLAFDLELAESLRQHPALLWKAQNAQKHHG